MFPLEALGANLFLAFSSLEGLPASLGLRSLPVSSKPAA